MSESVKNSEWSCPAFFGRMALVLIVLFMGQVVGSLAAQPAPKVKPVDAAYARVDSLYRARKWEPALAAVDAFRADFKKTDRESSVARIAAEAALKLRQLDRAKLEALTLVTKFKDSEYLDDAHWILADVALMAEQWDDAQREFNWLLGFARDTSLVSAARRGQIELREFLAAYDTSEVRSDASVARIGMILPLSGASADDAAAFLRGFNIRWEGGGGKPVIACDSEGDPVRGALLLRKLATEDSIRAVIGGFSDGEAAALAMESGIDKIPFITTMCRSQGLAELNRYTFQGRADYTRTGNELGRHAILDLGLARYAILTPATDAAKQMSRGFKEAIARQNGEVIAEEAFYPGTQDFSGQLSRIRALGRHRAFADSLRSSFIKTGNVAFGDRQFPPPKKALVPVRLPDGVEPEPGEEQTLTLSDAFIDSLWQISEQQIRSWIDDTKNTVDTLDTPVTAIDGFFIIVEPGAVPIVAAQIARFNIETQLLGGDGWDDRQALQQCARYVNGIVYPELYPPGSGDEFYRFAAALNQADGVPVNAYHLAGERAAQMALFAANHSQDRESFRQALSQISDLQTLSGNVSLLKEQRTDRNVRLIRFRDGQFNEEKPVSDQMPQD